MATNHLAKERRIKRAMPLIEKNIYRVLESLEVNAWLTDEPVEFEERLNGRELTLKKGDNWGTLFGCAWMNFKGKVPEGLAADEVVLLIDISGEGCIVNGKGEPVQGITTVSSEYDFSLGMPGKKIVYIDKLVNDDGIIDIWADAGNNDLFGKFQNSGTLVEADIAVMNKSMLGLHYDFEVLDGLRKKISDKSSRYIKITDALYKSAHKLLDYTEEEAREARKILLPELEKANADPSLKITAIGHAHIDLAWLWPIRETKRKAARTFSTALMNMEKYPEYIFGASQPQLYQWTKDLYPSVYKGIKKAFEDGRWELQGAMWVEADTNVSGGEALVRQMLYGKKFYRDEYDFDVRNVWLPDVFGYSAALPQIMKKSGVDYFMTIKISWNEINPFPHHTFKWRGLDGSEVLAHMPPEGTYNSSAAPRALIDSEEKFTDKDRSNECLLLYGIGDGGGGPGEEHLERLGREKNLQGLAPVSQGLSADFFERISKDTDAYATWSGELYLEHHRGTYTSEGRNKRYNKLMENLLRDTEIIYAVNNLKYPVEDLDRIWKEVLLYQFHDILPGSSIKRVYDESLERYSILEKELRELMPAESEKSGNIVFNSLGLERADWIKINGAWKYYTVPGLAYAEPDADYDEDSLDISISKENMTMENQNIKVQFNDNGEIISLIDKNGIGETIKKDAKANCISVFRDDGDAWDFPYDYREMELEKPELKSIAFETDGPENKLVAEYIFRNSGIRQETVLGDKSMRLEFRTVMDWRDTNTMVRSSFPLNLESDNITCGIQFGYIDRPSHDNTSWDMAKFEVCGQNYVDKSNGSNGFAVLSDYKYGYSSTLDTIEINLLRSTTFPDTEGDIGIHEFTYAAYPHSDGLIGGNVIQEAMDMSRPLSPAARPENGLPVGESFMKDENNNIVVETIKKAESGEGTVVRLYEPYGRQSKARLRFNRRYNSISEVNLIEDFIAKLADDADCLELAFTAFEIKTLLLK